jgi:two-component system, LytTR family, response regulator LytT
MKIVIIEDEKITAEDLAGTIRLLAPDAHIEAILSSVKMAIAYFQKNEMPDLVFSDVQLGDGLSFEIYKTVPVTAPIIFCTAYDEYALNAFRTNSIDYILKPFTSQTIEDALNKYKNLQRTFSGTNDLSYKSLIETLLHRDTPKSSAVLVHYKDKIMPVRLEEVALFYIENEVTHLQTFDTKAYSISKKLEELEQTCGRDFFRVNRQVLINRKAVIDASHYFLRKLSVNISVPFKEKIVVSKEKTPSFLKWLESIG